MSKRSIPFRPIYRRLDNGLQTAVVQKPGLRHGFALLATRFGSVDRQLHLPGSDQIIRLPAGIAHFLEHQLFDQKDGSISDRFAALGAQDNAFTHFGQTGYFFTTSNHFWDALDLLLSFTQTPYFEAGNVEQEKGIITQELRMYEDDPNAQGDLALRRLLFGDHPAGEDIGGTVKSIGEITPDLLYQCHHAFYRPDNMVLVVIGDLDPEQVFARASQMRVPDGDKPVQSVAVPKAKERVGAHTHRRSMHLSRPICMLGFKDREVGLAGAELLRRQVEMDILLDVLFGKSSPFYWQLYSQSLISDDFFSDYLALPSFAYTSVGGESLEPDRLVAAIQTEIKRAADRGIDAEVVERLKRKTLGEFVSSFNSSDGLAFALSSSLLTDTIYEELPTILQQVSAATLHERLRQQLHPDNSAVAVIEPR